MPKDTVGSQKVYVTLADYTAAQDAFTRIVALAEDSDKQHAAFRKAHPESTTQSTNYARITARGMAQIIRALKLPIDTHMVKP